METNVSSQLLLFNCEVVAYMAATPLVAMVTSTGITVLINIVQGSVGNTCGFTCFKNISFAINNITITIKGREL
jgi:hypothetical protein